MRISISGGETKTLDMSIVWPERIVSKSPAGLPLSIRMKGYRVSSYSCEAPGIIYCDTGLIIAESGNDEYELRESPL